MNQSLDPRSAAEELGIKILRNPEQAQILAAKFLADELKEGLNGALAHVRAELLKILPEGLSTNNRRPTLPPDLEIERQEFIAKYRLRILGDSQISFTLPPRTSRIEVLKEADILGGRFYGGSSVSYPTLKAWKKDREFLRKGKISIEKSIDGLVRNSANMTRSEQEARGWNNVDVWDLATGHAIFYVATGDDLFVNHSVRARDGLELTFYGSGLQADISYRDFEIRRDDPAHFRTAASATLPSSR